jgi:hypothetical protein
MAKWQYIFLNKTVWSACGLWPILIPLSSLKKLGSAYTWKVCNELTVSRQRLLHPCQGAACLSGERNQCRVRSRAQVKWSLRILISYPFLHCRRAAAIERQNKCACNGSSQSQESVKICSLANALLLSLVYNRLPMFQMLAFLSIFVKDCGIKTGHWPHTL